MGLKWQAVKRRLDRLGLEPGEWLVFGSGPMLAHGLISEVGDLDILARGDAWKQATALGTERSGSAGDRIVSIGFDVEVFDGWLGLPIEPIFERAVTVDGVLVASLRDVLEFKTRLGRPKDTPHIAMLKRALDAG